MIEGKGFKNVALIICLFFLSNLLIAAQPEGEHPADNHHQPIEESHSRESSLTSHDEEMNHSDQPAEHEKFDPGKFMFEHIEDAHDWHLFDLGEKSISIPLPVIVYSKETGVNIFWSSKFHHGHESYRGFHLGQEGETINKIDSDGGSNPVEVKGKIVETLSDGSQVLPLDISVTKNIVALFISVALLLIIFISTAKAYQRKPNQAPSGLQSFIEPAILFVRDDIAKPSIGNKHYQKFMPYLLTVFFFILINNLLGLIPIPPGGANLTGNIAVTGVLALFTFIITTINGNKSYWKHIVNTPGVPIWLKVPPLPIMPIVELIGVFTKPFILMVRLFANITAGHIIAMGFVSLIFIFAETSKFLGAGISIISILFIIFMSFLELLVAFIQAYVFTFLSAIYFGMAVEEHH